MDKLATQAAQLSRKIYASLPWGYRVAGLFMRLAMSTQEAVGRFVYAKFIAAGVTGMPDVKGEPALSMQDAMKGPRAESKLPSGYGRSFGEKLYRTLIGKFKNPEMVEEGISNMVVKMVSGQMKVDEGSALQQAESFVITSAINQVQDLLRKKKRTKTDQFQTDDEGVEVDVADPSSFRQVEDILSESQMRQMLQKVEQIHPRASEWITAILEGTSKRDLAEQWQVTPNAITNFENRYLDKIKRVVHDYIKDAA